MTDEFYSLSNVKLPQNADNIGAAISARECAEVCLRNCSCTAYSCTDSQCSIWHEELLNVKQQHADTTDTNDGAVLYLRLAAKEMQTQKPDRRVAHSDFVSCHCHRTGVAGTHIASSSTDDSEKQ